MVSSQLHHARLCTGFGVSRGLGLLVVFVVCKVEAQTAIHTFHLTDPALTCVCVCVCPLSDTGSNTQLFRKQSLGHDCMLPSSNHQAMTITLTRTNHQSTNRIDSQLSQLQSFFYPTLQHFNITLNHNRQPTPQPLTQDGICCIIRFHINQLI